MKSLKIWTDGACSPNPGRGGWAWVSETKESYGFIERTTNSRMEIQAVIDALTCNDDHYIEIYSDSTYVVNGATKWLEKWKERRKEVKNLDLWLHLDELKQGRVVIFNWVRGHSGNIMNERADSLANLAISRDKN